MEKLNHELTLKEEMRRYIQLALRATCVVPLN
jgi:hypothetical protein